MVFKVGEVGEVVQVGQAGQAGKGKGRREFSSNARTSNGDLYSRSFLRGRRWLIKAIGSEKHFLF